MSTYIKNLSGRKRLSLVLSVIWILGVTAVIKEEYRGSALAPFIGYGVLPLVIVWGIYWIRQGFKKEKKSNLKKCPYCAEEIKSDATKCRFCGEPVFSE